MICGVLRKTSRMASANAGAQKMSILFAIYDQTLWYAGNSPKCENVFWSSPARPSFAISMDGNVFIHHRSIYNNSSHQTAEIQRNVNSTNVTNINYRITNDTMNEHLTYMNGGWSFFSIGSIVFNRVMHKSVSAPPWVCVCARACGRTVNLHSNL